MKIHELNNGDNFEADFYNPETDELCWTLTGKFLHMAGYNAVDGGKDFLE